MVNTSLIPSIKKSCMTLGIRQKDVSTPYEIGGTAFTIDPDGFVITADHVTEGLKKRLKELNETSEKFELVAFFIIENGTDNAQLVASPIKEIRSLVIKIKDLENYLPQDHDIAICRIYGKWGSLPYLKLKKPTSLNVYTEIFMCGYPRGDSTLNVSDRQHGLRLSPILQTGRISSLMPSDNTTRPIGIQTDIFGMGGSSGSPIVDANDGEVIGIAQHVFPPTVLDKLLKPIGTAHIGLVWGISSYFTYDAVYKMIGAMKQNMNEVGEPLTKEGHVIKLSYTAGEGSFSEFKS